jgi:hypothetical protein
MTDRELLELAARAIGLQYHSYVENELIGRGLNIGDLETPIWNPLTDDGDALRLAVRLRIAPTFSSDGRAVFSGYCTVTPKCGRVYHDPINEFLGEDPLSAWKRAVVRRAAAIGKEMK